MGFASSMGDRYTQNATEGVASRVSEPVLMVAFASPPGAMNSVISGKLSEIATGIGQAIPHGRIVREGGSDTRLPTSFLVAITPDHRVRLRPPHVLGPG